MKTQINYLFTFCLVLCLFFSCKSDDDNNPVINADTYSGVNDLVNALKEDPQTFSISDPSIANTITGEDGTVIQINANAFIDASNNPVTNAVTASLSEYLTLDKMVKNNVQTTSSGQLLVTGGSFDLTFKDATNGNPVSVNPFSVQASIPVQTDISGLENDMQYYTGNRTTVDGREMVDWQLGGQSEFWFSEGLFNITGFDLGLANCDVLYDLAGETGTQFEVTVSGVTDYSNATVWLFIDDFPSVVSLTSLNASETALKTYDNSIPVGLNGTLLAITIDDDNYLKYGTLPITVAGDDTFNVTVDFGTTADLGALISTLAN